ncbi:MAG: TetR/AcrR family transcriptional regulator [Candidatus Cloacimonadota bacterium]|nr:TetR/AcrR family transcriptional regulator [Candidatus Cloacimonadota bacterium]
MAIADRKERERKQREQTILSAAEDIFLSKGYDHSTMEDIAQKAELSKGTLYLYFQNKNELCMAITINCLKVLQNKINNIFQQKINGIQKFLLLPKVYQDFQKNHSRYFKGLLTHQFHRYDCPNDGKIFQKWLAENNKINQSIVCILEEGISDGSIKPNIDKHKMAVLIWGEQNGILLSSLFSEAKHRTGELMDYFFLLLAQAIGTRSF